MCLRFISFFTAFCLCVPVWGASDDWKESVNLSGFIGVGGAYSSANNLLGNDNSSSELFEGGIRINVSLPANLEFNGQVMHRRFGDNFTESGLRIDFASLDWRSQLLGDGEQLISVGRVKTPSGIYNTTRDVPFTRPSVLLAQSVYLDIFRNFLLNTDGVRFGSTHSLANGELSLEAGVGDADLGGTWNDLALGQGIGGQWDSSFGDARFFDLRFAGQRWQLSMTYHGVNVDYTAQPGQLISGPLPGLALPLIDGGIETDSWILGLQFTQGPWELTTEYVYRDIETFGLVPPGAPIERPIEGYYGQARYYLTPEVVLMARWDRFFRNADDKDGREFTSIGLPSWLSYTTTRTLGVNWQISPQWALAAEVHWNDGAGWLPPFSVFDLQNVTDRKWTLGLAQLSYRF